MPTVRDTAETLEVTLDEEAGAVRRLGSCDQVDPLSFSLSSSSPSGHLRGREASNQTPSVPSNPRTSLMYTRKSNSGKFSSHPPASLSSVFVPLAAPMLSSANGLCCLLVSRKKYNLRSIRVVKSSHSRFADVCFNT